MTRHKMTRRQRMRAQYVAAGALIIIAAAGALLFLRGSSSTTRTTGAAAPTTVRHIAQPAGPNPSASAQMVCAPEAQRELTTALGVTATAVTTPTWVDHVYSCNYAYPNGAIGVSVKELSSRAETTTYFASLRARLGQSQQLKGVAQGAFVSKDGSLVLRKDYKVLLVDTSNLPVPFGSGFSTRSQVSVGVGITVLGCWTGA
jgi:hypothetical protein